MNDEVEWVHLLFRGNQPPRSTFDRHQDDYYMIEFKKKGLVAISVPVLEYVFINVEELSRLLKDSILNNDDDRCSTGLVITSPRVVEAVRRAVQLIPSEQERDKIFRGLEQELVLAVGEVSGKRCQSELGIEYNRDAAKAGDARSLAEYIKRNLNEIEGRTFRLIYPRSSRSDDIIEKTLQNNSTIDMRSIVAYETKPIKDLENILNDEIMNLKLNIDNMEEKISRLMINLIFFSPSGLESFLTIDETRFVQQLASNFPGRTIELRYSSIGKTTEAALLRNNLNVFCVSKSPDANSLVESILSRGF